MTCEGSVSRENGEITLLPTANPSQKRNHQEPEPPTAQLSCHPCPAWALCGSLAGAVVPSRLVLTVRALRQERRKSEVGELSSWAIVDCHGSNCPCREQQPRLPAPWHPRHAHAQQLHQPERLPRIPQPTLTVSPRPRLLSPVSRAGRRQGGGQEQTHGQNTHCHGRAGCLGRD